ncbi:glycosyltransferase, partial [Candidatus Curtissbacteria bacterium]|nr:glycosyltransferase [Candidatus Curtissbacteria bacterium]
MEALAEIWPKAPIYTAFWQKNSPVYERFKKRKIITSWAQKVPFFASKLHSPLRFLAPLIWNSFSRQLADYDVVISSASWYVTKGVTRKGTKSITGIKSTKGTIEVCYCHTPPRYLYGYPTSVNWQKYWPVRIYALVVNHFMRVYDFEAAQRVDWFIANSKEVQSRIKKFYRRDSVVVYPPVEVKKLMAYGKRQTAVSGKQQAESYFLVVSRIVGAKGLALAVEAANKLGIKLKVVGKGAGYSNEYQKMKDIAGENVEFLGYVDDEKLARLYAGAKAFLALAVDEDFGMTPVEAMLSGTPVIAYRGGGYLETVVDGKTGVLFSQNTPESLTLAINKFIKLSQKGAFDPEFIKRHA